jgi:hypothetical protein
MKNTMLSLAALLVLFSCKEKVVEIRKEIRVADEAPNPFPELQELTFDSAFHLSYPAAQTRILNIPCNELPENDPNYCPDEDFGISRKLATIKLSGVADSLTIWFSPGPSEDPTFMVVNAKGKELGSIFAKSFYILPDGSMYSAGHTNTMFDKRRKFLVEQDTLREVAQPFYAVNIKGELMKEVVLYASAEGDEITARLPQGAYVEIVLAAPAKDEYAMELNYLVKTSFGQIGWMRLTQEQLGEEIIKGLFYAGD